jgi:hypothetical protein
MDEIIADLRVLGKDIYRNLLKYPLQRLFKGYCDKDLWGLDVYMARRILPALIAFRKQKIYGHPNNFKTQKEWLNCIDTMIFGLKYVLDDGVHNFKKKKSDEAQKGLELLGANFQSLWD